MRLANGAAQGAGARLERRRGWMRWRAPTAGVEEAHHRHDCDDQGRQHDHHAVEDHKEEFHRHTCRNREHRTTFDAAISADRARVRSGVNRRHDRKHD